MKGTHVQYGLLFCIMFDHVIPPKFNITPDKRWFEDYLPLGIFPIFRGYVKLQECISPFGRNIRCYSKKEFDNLYKFGKNSGGSSRQSGRRTDATTEEYCVRGSQGLRKEIDIATLKWQRDIPTFDVSLF